MTSEKLLKQKRAEALKALEGKNFGRVSGICEFLYAESKTKADRIKYNVIGGTLNTNLRSGSVLKVPVFTEWELKGKWLKHI